MKKQRKRAPRKRPAPDRSQQLLDPGERGTERQIDQDAKLRKSGYWFDGFEADRICAFYERHLTHSKGEWAGKRIVLEPWQREKIRRLFGWRRPDGTRRYRRSFWGLPRKNGKSLVASGVALYLTTADGEPGAEVFAAASNREQADAVYGEAEKMVEASASLSAICEVFKTAIFMPRSLSRFRAISSKPGSKHGFNPHGVICDELHAWKDRELYDALTTGGAARRQPMEFVITTAGYDLTSVCYECWDYAVSVLEGNIDDPHFLPVIYAADKDDDWREPATWRKANPNLGVSVKEEYLREQVADAKNKPARVNIFKRLHLNVWTQQAERFFDMERWDDCPNPAEQVSLRGRRCFVGIDLSRRVDLTAVVYLFPLEAGRFIVVPRFFAPEDGVEERERRDRVPYRLWAQQGLLTLTPGNVVDYGFIRQVLLEAARNYDIVEIAYDPWGSTQLALQLQDDGLTCVEFLQHIKHMSEPTKALEALVLEGKLIHRNNPLLRWMADGAVVVSDASGNIKLAKNKTKARIDGLVALIMALGRATLGQHEDSVYKKRGVIVI